MNFRRKYEMLNLIVGSEIMRFEGQEIESKRPVVLHLLIHGYSDENQRLLRTISQLPQELRCFFLETGEYQHVPFVITQHFDESLPDWLKANSAPESEVIAAIPGQFNTVTVLGTAIQSQEGQLEPLGVEKPGEFTMLFKTPPRAAGELKNASPPPPVPSPRSGGPTTGNSAKDVQVAAVVEGPSSAGVGSALRDEVSRRPPEGPNHGDFTLFFQVQPAVSGAPSQPAQSTPATLEVPRLAEETKQKPAVTDAKLPGMFRQSTYPRENARESRPASESYGQRNDKVNPLAIVERWGSADPLPAATPSPPVYSPAPQTGDPGAYTQVIRHKTAPPDHNRADGPAAADEGGSHGRQSYVPLVIVMLALLVLTVALILFFAVR